MTGSRSASSNAFDDPERIVARVHALEQDDELVAAEARQRVARTHHAAQPLADDAQELVAHLMAEIVVDHLEAVDVTEEHGDLAPGSVRLEQRMVDVVKQQPSVGQTRERVLERMTGQLFLERLAFRRVAEDDHRARRRAARPQATP